MNGRFARINVYHDSALLEIAGEGQYALISPLEGNVDADVFWRPAKAQDE